jgi:hypothetical protein
MMIHRFISLRKHLRFTLFLIALAALSGCETVTVASSIPANFEVSKRHPQTVRVAVKGGVESHFGGRQQVPPDIFRQALLKSIAQTRLFAAVKNDKSAELQLDVTLYKTKNGPSAGLDADVILYANWRLRNLRTHRIVYQERIESHYLETVGQTLSGSARMVHAVEGAMRRNIHEGIRRISLLEIPAR